jgi:hypothetical protein
MDSFVLRRLQSINQCYGNLIWEITQMFVEGLFERVLSQIDELPMPRQRRQALAASN